MSSGKISSLTTLMPLKTQQIDAVEDTAKLMPLKTQQRHSKDTAKLMTLKTQQNYGVHLQGIRSKRSNGSMPAPRIGTVGGGAIGTDINPHELVLCIHQGNNYGEKTLVVVVDGPRVCRSLDRDVLAIECARRMQEVSPVVKLLTHYTPAISWGDDHFCCIFRDDGLEHLLHKDGNFNLNMKK